MQPIEALLRDHLAFAEVKGLGLTGAVKLIGGRGMRCVVCHVRTMTKTPYAVTRFVTAYGLGLGGEGQTRWDTVFIAFERAC